MLLYLLALCSGFAQSGTDPPLLGSSAAILAPPLVLMSIIASRLLWGEAQSARA